MSKTKKQIEIEVNGQAANASLRDLGKFASQVRKELWGMSEGAEGFEKKSALLETVRERYKKLKAEAEGVARKQEAVAEAAQKVGASYNDIKAYVEQLEAETKELNRSTAEYVEKSEELDKVKAQFEAIKQEQEGVVRKQQAIAEAAQKVGASYNDIKAYLEQLDTQTKNLNRSSDEYIQKSKELERVREQFKAVKDEQQGIALKQQAIAEAAQKVGASYDDVKAYMEQLDAQTKKLNRSSNEYIQKSQELERVREQFKAIKDEQSGVKKKQEELVKQGKKIGASYNEVKAYVEQLDRELKNLPKSAARLAKVKELEEAKKRFAEIEKEISDTSQEAKELTVQSRGAAVALLSLFGIKNNLKEDVDDTGKSVSSLGSIAKAVAGPLIAMFAVGEIINYGKELLNVTDKMVTLRNEIASTFGVQGKELDNATIKISALSGALDVEAASIIETAKATQTQLGGSLDSHLAEIQKNLSSLKKGQRGEALEQMKEYAKTAKELGADLGQFSAVINNGLNQGIQSDKAIDSLNEFVIKVREMGKGTQDAFKAIGMSHQKVTDDLLTGKKTYMDVAQDVAKALTKIPEESTQVGQALADMFGGPGEDAGIKYIKSLANVGKGLDETTLKSSKMYQENQRRIAQEEKLAAAQNAVAKELEEASKKAGSFKVQLQVIAYKVALKLIQGFKSLMSFLKPGFDKVKSAVQGVIGAMGGWKKVFGQVAALYKAAFNIIVAPLKSIFKFATLIANKFGGWKEIIRKVGTVFKTSLGTIVKTAETIGKAFGAVSSIIGSIINRDWKGTWNKIKAGWKGLGKSIRSIGRGIQEGIGDFFNTEAAQKRHAKEAAKIAKENALKAATAAKEAARQKAIAEAKARKEAAQKAERKAKDLAERQKAIAEARRLKWLENLKQHYANLHKVNDVWLTRELTKLKEQLYKKEIDQKTHDRKVFEAQRKAARQKAKLFAGQFGKQSKQYQDAYSGYLDIVINREKALADAAKKAHQEKLKAVDESLNKELTKLKAQLVALHINETEYDSKSYGAKRAALRQKLELVEKQSGKESAAYQKLYDQLLTLQQNEAKRQAAEKKKSFDEQIKIADEAYKNDLAELQKKLNNGEISEREYYKQSEVLLSAHWGKKLSVARAMYGVDSKEFQEFLKAKNDAEEKLDKAAGKARGERLKKAFADAHEITSEASDLALGIIKDGTDKKLAALEDEASRMREFWEEEKTKEQEKYEEAQAVKEERYEAEKEQRDERFEEEKEALQAHYEALRNEEQTEYDRKREVANNEYEAQKAELQAQLQALRDNGKGKTTEAKAIEKKLKDLQVDYNKQKRADDLQHKAKLKALDQKEKAEAKAREQAHKAEQKKRDDEFRQGQKRAEELHKKLLATLEKNQTEEEKRAKAEQLRIKKEAHQKSKVFSIAQIWTQLGVEVAGYFAHPGSIASLGAVGWAKLAMATARAAAQTAAVNKREFGKGGYLKPLRMLANGGRLYAGANNGMIVRGAPHANGGIQLYDMARGEFLPENIEGNEAIVSARRTAQNPETVKRLISGTENLDQLLFARTRIDETPIKRFANGGSTSNAGNTTIGNTQNTGNINEALEMVAAANEALAQSVDRLNFTQEELSLKMDNLEAKISLDHYQDVSKEIAKLNNQVKVD